VQRLRQEMERLATEMKFEQAAQLRDWLSSLDTLTEKQKVITADPISRDIFGLAVEDDVGAVVILQVRRGRKIGRFHYRLRHLKDQPFADVLQSALEQYYSDPVFFPEEIVLPEALPEQSLLQVWLNEQAGQRVEIRVPERGERAQFIELARKNAELMLGEIRIAREAAERIPHSLKQLQAHLSLPHLPRVIAAFDISNLLGTDKVASMVVFRNGRAARSEYRRYQIKTVEGIDDFSAMREVVSRRFSRLQREATAFPDLVLIDGGKGQLSAAVNALAELEITTQPLIGLAKQLEEVFVPGDSIPLNIPKSSSALKLLQQVRDEAHRFALSYHRELRKKRSFHSHLDDIEGVGPTRKKMLLTHFGSLRNLEAATLEELQQVPGVPETIARNVYSFFQERRGSAPTP
jgi:excinuclease ABC subunit C